MVDFMYIYIPRNVLGSDIENKTWNTRYDLCSFYKYNTDVSFHMSLLPSLKDFALILRKWTFLRVHIFFLEYLIS